MTIGVAHMWFIVIFHQERRGSLQFSWETTDVENTRSLGRCHTLLSWMPVARRSWLRRLGIDAVLMEKTWGLTVGIVHGKPEHARSRFYDSTHGGSHLCPQDIPELIIAAGQQPAEPGIWNKHGNCEREVSLLKFRPETCRMSGNPDIDPWG